MGGSSSKKKKQIKVVNRKSEYFQTTSNNLQTQNIDKLSTSIILYILLSDCDFSKYFFEISQTLSDKTTLLMKSPQIIGTNFENNNSIILSYYFEREQLITINLFQNNHKFVFKFTIGKIMGSQGQRLVFELDPKKDIKGNLIVQVETCQNDNYNFEFKLNANIEGKNIDPYFYVKKDFSTNNENVLSNVFKSEVLNNNINGLYEYEKFKIDCLKFASSNSKPLIFEFYNAIVDELIGVITVNIGDSFDNAPQNIALLKNNKKTSNSVSIVINKLKIYKFVDYLRGGLQISIAFGIDFTASNGPIEDIRSLHSIMNSDLNYYEKAIQSCGNIVSPYDSDQLFPVFGYGAKIQSKDETLHCFPINFEDDANIYTIPNILPIYRKCLAKIQLYGPTYFAPIINATLKHVKSLKKDCYYILMILTDGQINDMEETISALVDCSYHPLSLIIVGIGKGDFSSMERLDGDIHPLVNSKGVKASRDLVQFVEFNKFMNDGVRLASEVLEEIPKQIEEFYMIMKKNPTIPVKLSTEKMI